MLVFIEGGPEPFVNKAYESDVLLEHPGFIATLQDYRATNRTITSAVDPTKVAQVWAHVSALEPQPSPIPTAAEDPNSTASAETTRETVTTMAPVEEVPEAAQLASSPPAVAESATSASSDVETDMSPSAEAVPATVAEDAGDLPDGEQLFLRRRKLKLTVQEVADAIGLARSRVDAIEKGTAKRGDVAADVRVVHEFLTGREGGGSPRA